MTEPVLGQPHAGYWYEYETHAFVHPEGTTGGKSFRTGIAGANGKFSFQGLDTTPAYSLVGFQQTFFNGVPCMIDRIRFHDGKNAPLLLNEPEFSCGNGDLTPWGATRWTSANSDFYQTFVARSGSVRRVTARTADNHSGQPITIGVVEDNGGAIGTWPYVAAMDGGQNPKQINWPGTGADFHVSWRSGQVPMTPGTTYAVKIHAVGFSGFSLYARSISASMPHIGYQQGSVWADGSERSDWDMLGIVEGDADGKLVTMGPLSHYSNRFSGATHGNFGQTWTAKGRGLAAVTMAAIVADPVDSRIFTLRVYDSPAKTNQIGPTKTVPGAWYLPNLAALAFSYCPGEINLTPGQDYYFELSCPTAFQVDTLHDNESYPDGQAYYNGSAQASRDLACYLLEYQKIETEVVPPTVTSTTNWLTNASFEDYDGFPWIHDIGHFPDGIQPVGWTVTHDDATKNRSSWTGATGSMAPGWNTVNAQMGDRGQTDGGGFIGYKQGGDFGGPRSGAFNASIKVAGEATTLDPTGDEMYEEALRFRLTVRFLDGATVVGERSTGWVGFWGPERQFVPLELSDYITNGATGYEYEIEGVCYMTNTTGFAQANIIGLDDAFLAFDLEDAVTSSRIWERLK